MIAYEVTAEIAPELSDRYVRYMTDRHVPDLLATGCFVGAELDRAGPGRFRQRYLADSREDLDRYLAEYAPALRKDFARHFPSGTSLSRETWEELESVAASRLVTRGP
jgi:Domain of unknown function (DUF4286)